MLNKIENISTNTDFARSSAKNTSGIDSIYSHSHKLNFNDSLTFSSAFVLLSKIHWKLRKFKLEHNRLVHIEFSADEIIFSSTIDISDPEAINYGRYQITSLISFEDIAENWCAEIFFNTINKQSAGNSRPVSFPICKQFLKNILERAAYSRTDFWDNTIYEEILGGLKTSLHNELSEIHIQVLMFIEMITGNSIIPADYQNQSNNQELKIINIFRLNE